MSLATKSYINRVLRSLAEIHESPESTPEERIQALRLTIEALDRRPSPRRTTAKERAITAALSGPKKKAPAKAEAKIP